MQSQLKISIITPIYNRVELISEAINSVLDQNYPCFEHIIVDGGSTDGTLSILSNYPHLRVISEPDKGVYDALNKGIQAATGDIIGLINSDDFYAADTFNQISSFFIRGSKAKVLVGGAKVFIDTKSGREISAEYPSGTIRNLPKKLTTGVPAINAWFFQTNLIKKLGVFDLSYRVAADRHFLITLLKDISFSEIAFTEKFTYYYRQHSSSMTITGQNDYYNEFVFEHLRIAEFFINNRSTPNVLRRACCQWHSKDTSNLVIQNFFSSPSIAWQFMCSGFRHNPFWVFHLFHQIVIHFYNALVVK